MLWKAKAAASTESAVTGAATVGICRAGFVLVAGVLYFFIEQ
jgi:hypothetical protein